MQKNAQSLQAELQRYASDSDAIFLQRFFKTRKGEYGEGDVFIGVRVPNTRKVCRSFNDLPLTEIKILLDSPIHEHRLAATIIMSGQYKKADTKGRKQLLDMYLRALDDGNINNWDIVDTSCEHIVGAWSRDHDAELLFELAKRDGIWHKRVSIISCFAWIRNKDIGPTIELAEILWPETHDLLQKAAGWMLREAGKVDDTVLYEFLDRHSHEMPRTQLRYAIEKLPTTRRIHYMNQKTNIV